MVLGQVAAARAHLADRRLLGASRAQALALGLARVKAAQLVAGTAVASGPAGIPAAAASGAAKTTDTGWCS